MDGLYLPPKPAIIQAAEPWEIRAHAEMAKRGLARNVRRAVVAEIKRLQRLSARQIVPAASIKGLSRYAGEALPLSLGGMILNPYSFGGADATVTYTDVAVSATDQTTYDFGTRAIGTAATGRRIIVGVGAANSTGVSRTVTLTVGGNSATQVVSLGANGSSAIAVAAVFIIQVDAGTTANITATFSGSCLDAGIAVWAAYDLQSSTATDTISDDTSPLSTTALDIQAGGIAVAFAYVNGSGTTTFTWSGLTERVDSVVESAVSLSGASDAFAAAQTGPTITATPSAFSSGTLVAAAFR